MDFAIDEILGQATSCMAETGGYVQPASLLKAKTARSPNDSIITKVTPVLGKLCNSTELAKSPVPHQHVPIPILSQNQQPPAVKRNLMKRFTPNKGYESFGSDEEIVCPKKPLKRKTELEEEWQRDFEWDSQIDQANKDVFGNSSFRENQREIINATKSNKDVLALIPTGGGKSLTF